MRRAGTARPWAWAGPGRPWYFVFVLYILDISRTSIWILFGMLFDICLTYVSCFFDVYSSQNPPAATFGISSVYAFIPFEKARSGLRWEFWG